MGLADTIRDRRSQLKLTQSAVGLKMWPDTSAQNAGLRIKRFESGQKPKVHELNLLAEALEMDVAELLEAEYGPRWSSEIVDGGVLVNKEVIEELPDIKGLLETLNTVCANKLRSLIRPTLDEIGKLESKHLKEVQKEPPPRSSKIKKSVA